MIGRATRRARSLLSIVMVAALSACATSSALRCGPGEQAAVNDTNYFGTARPDGGQITADDWAAFIASAVTPRFPQGLTGWRAAGQWRDADGTIIHEDSYVLNLVHPDDAATDEALRAIGAEYKSRFRQEAVLRIRSFGCMSL